MVLNFSPAIVGIGGTSTPLKIVGSGTSSAFASSFAADSSAGPMGFSADSANTTEEKMAPRSKLGRKRIVKCVSPECLRAFAARPPSTPRKVNRIQAISYRPVCVVPSKAARKSDRRLRID